MSDNYSYTIAVLKQRVLSQLTRTIIDYNWTLREFESMNVKDTEKIDMYKRWIKAEEDKKEEVERVISFLRNTNSPD